ncbi:MAG: hypothetical protein ABH827_00585 [bacterium]
MKSRSLSSKLLFVILFGFAWGGAFTTCQPKATCLVAYDSRDKHLSEFYEKYIASNVVKGIIKFKNIDKFELDNIGTLGAKNINDLNKIQNNAYDCLIYLFLGTTNRIYFNDEANSRELIKKAKHRIVISVRNAQTIQESVIPPGDLLPQRGDPYGLKSENDLIVHFSFKEETLEKCDNNQNKSSQKALEEFLGKVADEPRDSRRQIITAVGGCESRLDGAAPLLDNELKSVDVKKEEDKNFLNELLVKFTETYNKLNALALKVEEKIPGGKSSPGVTPLKGSLQERVQKLTESLGLLKIKLNELTMKLQAVKGAL